MIFAGQLWFPKIYDIGFDPPTLFASVPLACTCTCTCDSVHFHTRHIHKHYSQLVRPPTIMPPINVHRQLCCCAVPRWSACFSFIPDKAQSQCNFLWELLHGGFFKAQLNLVSHIILWCCFFVLSRICSSHANVNYIVQWLLLICNLVPAKSPAKKGPAFFDFIR